MHSYLIRSRTIQRLKSLQSNPVHAMLVSPGINRSAGQFTTSNLSVPFLIRWAYDLDEDRLAGVPKGFDSARFDITAKTSADEKLIPGVTLRLMMQNLLADRFKLRCIGRCVNFNPMLS